jgi:bifunctional UDP-N-acetylglucosamine pyrophosphorylase/glucosamine-1-phosphate N-acetyltransferase
MAVLGAKVVDPSGYGRLLRRAGQGPDAPLERIVEHKDCTEAQRRIDEINSGIYCIEAAFLRDALPRLSANNAQNELYLTDVVAMAADRAHVPVHLLADADEARGVNSRVDLGEVEGYLRRRLVREHQQRGVTFVAPDSVRLAPTVVLGADVTIGVGVQLLGQTQVHGGAHIDGPTVVIDCTVAADAHIHAFSHCQGAEVGPGAQVGPYARLRPGACVGRSARVGNFVEVKNSTLKEGAKANHLAYIGDAVIDEKANIGAGTITCNYDGFHKHKTHVGRGAFVGSNSTLVAPIDIGEGAITAAGSTLTEDVPDDAVAFGRARQSNLPERAKALREKLA